MERFCSFGALRAGAGKTLVVALRVVTLLDKPDRRVVEFRPDYTLFTIPDHFVIGYGLDCGELFRNLPYIAEYNQDI